MAKLTKKDYCKKLLGLRESGGRFRDFLGQKHFLIRVVCLIIPILLFFINQQELGYWSLGMLMGAILVDIRYANSSKNIWGYWKDLIAWEKVELGAEEEG